jgi:hypothetical protein
MFDYIRQNGSQILDGLLFGLGILAVYLGAILSGALIRSLSGAGSTGITFVGRYVRGWWEYLRGDDRNIINVTLNMIVDNRLNFDTLVADRRLWFVWPNAYRVMLIRRAARRTTKDNPVVLFPEIPQPKSWAGRCMRRCGDGFRLMLASARTIENGRWQRVRLQPEDDYKATYGPLISLVSEKCSNDNAIDLALGHPMEEHRFVIALTFEQLHNRRARHLRAMVIYEPTLRDLPEDMPQVDFEEHKTRYRTLQAIARQYATHPERFGIVKLWRHKAAKSGQPVEIGIGLDRRAHSDLRQPLQAGSGAASQRR